MKRAALVILLALAVGTPATAYAAIDHADCGKDIRAIKLKMPTVKEPARREELQKLLAKADKDDKAGRDKLCDETIKHANALLK